MGKRVRMGESFDVDIDQTPSCLYLLVALLFYFLPWLSFLVYLSSFVSWAGLLANNYA